MVLRTYSRHARFLLGSRLFGSLPASWEPVTSITPMVTGGAGNSMAAGRLGTASHYAKWPAKPAPSACGRTRVSSATCSPSVHLKIFIYLATPGEWIQILLSFVLEKVSRASCFGLPASCPGRRSGLFALLKNSEDSGYFPVDMPMSAAVACAPLREKRSLRPSRRPSLLTK
jgi:hypothetical protein